MNYLNKDTAPICGDLVRSANAETDYLPGEVFSFGEDGSVNWGWQGSNDPDRINIILNAKPKDLVLVQRPSNVSKTLQ